MRESARKRGFYENTMRILRTDDPGDGADLSLLRRGEYKGKADGIRGACDYTGVKGLLRGAPSAA